MLRNLVFIFVLMASIVTAMPSARAGGQRIALLIGNQDYKPGVGSLKNPINDVKLIGKTLKTIGFEVLSPLTNATRQQILLAVNDFAGKLSNAGPDAVGFIYYSGHGVASAGKNYIIPVDVAEPTTRLLSVQGVKQAEILDILRSEAPNAAHYLVLDACRNNLQGSRGGKGFVRLNQQSGILVAYAAEPGKTASDTGASSGPYAAALARELVKPGQSDLIMFHRVRVAVSKATNGDQVPWTEDGIQRETRMNFGIGDAVTPTAGVVVETAGRTWREMGLETTNDLGLLEAFVKQYDAREPLWAYRAQQRLNSLKRSKITKKSKKAAKKSQKLASLSTQKPKAAKPSLPPVSVQIFAEGVDDKMEIFIDGQMVGDCKWSSISGCDVSLTRSLSGVHKIRFQLTNYIYSGICLMGQCGKWAAEMKIRVNGKTLWQKSVEERDNTPGVKFNSSIKCDFSTLVCG